jgi:hypothetical protein
MHKTFMEVEMALLQVRNFPDDLYEEISRIARSERRSIAQQTVVAVENGLRANRSNAERRRDALQRTISRDLPDVVATADVVRMIREDRER